MKSLSYLEFSVPLRASAILSFSHRSSKSLLKDLSYSARHESCAVPPINICRSSGGSTILVGSGESTSELVTFQGAGANFMHYHGQNCLPLTMSMAVMAADPSMFLAEHVYCPVSSFSTLWISRDPLSWTVNLGPLTDVEESSLLLENVQNKHPLKAWSSLRSNLIYTQQQFRPEGCRSDA